MKNIALKSTTYATSRSQVIARTGCALSRKSTMAAFPGKSGQTPFPGFSTEIAALQALKGPDGHHALAQTGLNELSAF